MSTLIHRVVMFTTSVTAFFADRSILVDLKHGLLFQIVVAKFGKVSIGNLVARSLSPVCQLSLESQG